MLLLLIATTSLLRDPQVPVVIGLVRGHGATGILTVLLAALCGLAALVGTIRRRAWASALLLVYSLCWLVTLTGALVVGALHVTVAAMQRTSPWGLLVGGVTFAVMLAAFALLAVWSIRQLAGRSGDDAVS